MVNKKGQAIGGFTSENIGRILLVLFILTVILIIILGWASPAFGKVTKWISNLG